MAKTSSENKDVFEYQVVGLMAETGLFMSEAMVRIMVLDGVDVDSVFDMCDFLEEKLGDLNKVSVFMQMINGQLPDCFLKKL